MKKRLLIVLLLMASLVLPFKTVMAAGPTFTATLANGTGTATGAPITMTPGITTVVATGAGSFTITLPVGTTGVCTSGTATITSSPKALIAGANSVTTGVTTGNFTVDWGYPDVEGPYTIKTNLSLRNLDNTKVTGEGGVVVKSLAGTLTITTQLNGVISDAEITFDNVAEVAIELQGYVDHFDRTMRIVLYGVPPAEPSGDDYVIIVTGIVKVDKTTGAVTGIQSARVRGIDQNSTPYTFDGTFKATPGRPT